MSVHVSMCTSLSTKGMCTYKGTCLCFRLVVSKRSEGYFKTLKHLEYFTGGFFCLFVFISPVVSCKSLFIFWPQIITLHQKINILWLHCQYAAVLFYISRPISLCFINACFQRSPGHRWPERSAHHYLSCPNESRAARVFSAASPPA